MRDPDKTSLNTFLAGRRVLDKFHHYRHQELFVYMSLENPSGHRDLPTLQEKIEAVVSIFFEVFESPIMNLENAVSDIRAGKIRNYKIFT